MKSLNTLKFLFVIVSIVFLSLSCKENPSSSDVDLGISPVSNADARSSYTYSKTDILVDYSPLSGTYWNFSQPEGPPEGLLWDAIAYLDSNGEGLTDVFMGTGAYLSHDEVACVLFINDGSGNFTPSTAEFNDNMPPATHARKSIVSDFTNNGLLDILVLDHGYDSDPFPGSNPKLILQNSVGSFSWSKLTDQTGFHHAGAAADIDNDGDIDIFIAGLDPFFYVNDSSGNFTKTDDRFDHSIDKIFAAELIDVDKDGFIDLLVGAHEQDGDETSIYWGNSNGSYNSSLRTILPAFTNFGTILDIEAEDVEGDGDRDLIIQRVGGGNDNFYAGGKIQLLIHDGNRGFTDKTQQFENPDDDFASWNTAWLRGQDIDSDGDIDFFFDDRNMGVVYINDGNGNFTQTYSE
ncbi:MAG: VCBS repeat-containing protein [Balneolaceae bacterium]